MRRSASSRPNAASWVRNDSTRLSESIKKSAGRTSPASPARNLAAERRLSSDGARSCRRESHVGDHAPVPPARRAVREKVVAVMRAAPGRDRDLGDTQLARLPGQDFPEVHMTRRPVGAVDRGAAPRGTHTRIRLVNPGHPRRGQPLNDLRTYFIARTANTNSTMHYDFRRSDQRGTLQDLYATLEDPPRRAAPPGVEQCHHLLTWHGEVDWDAVGDGDGEQRAARSRHMAVDSVDDQPPVGPVLVPLDRGAVHLVGENHARELLAYRGADGAPPGHHLPDVLSLHSPREKPGSPAPALPPRVVIPATIPNRSAHSRSSMRGTAGSGAGCSRNARRSDGRTVGEIVTGPPCDCRAGPRVVRCARLAPAAVRRSARTRVRSARCCGSGSRLAPPARRAAWPCRP